MNPSTRAGDRRAITNRRRRPRFPRVRLVLQPCFPQAPPRHLGDQVDNRPRGSKQIVIRIGSCATVTPSICFETRVPLACVAGQHFAQICAERRWDRSVRLRLWDVDFETVRLLGVFWRLRVFVAEWAPALLWIGISYYSAGYEMPRGGKTAAVGGRKECERCASVVTVGVYK